MSDTSQTDGLSQLLGSAFETMLDDLVRARAFVSEAVPGLITSFNGLRAELKKQHTEMELVSAQLQGSEDSGGFLKRMAQVVDLFVKDLITVSHNSMKMVERVESLGTEVEQIVGHVTHIETMAKETRFVALNARIEAHRAGDSGRTFRVVADEVKALADDATSFSGQIRDVVSRCHERLDHAREAVAVLASHDMNSALDAQQGVLQMLQRLDETNGRISEALLRIDQHVDQAIRAMQFEDILTQLLGQVHGRLSHVRDAWVEWQASLQTKSPDAAMRLQRTLENVKSSLERPSVVSNATLTTGSVELF